MRTGYRDGCTGIGIRCISQRHRDNTEKGSLKSQSEHYHGFPREFMSTENSSHVPISSVSEVECIQNFFDPIKFNI